MFFFHRLHNGRLPRELPHSYHHVNGDFGDVISKRVPELEKLADKLLEKGKKVYLLNYGSSTFPHDFYSKYKDRIVNLGVEPDVAKRFDNKLEQFDFLKREGFTLPEFDIGSQREVELAFEDERFNDGNGLYVSIDNGSGGNGVVVARNKKDLGKFLSEHSGEDFLFVRGLDLKDSYSIDALVTDNEIRAFCPSSSIFSQFNKAGCIGSITPIINKEHYKKLHELASNYLQPYVNEGLRGFVNLDFNLDGSGNLHYGELNPRPGASTGNKISFMDACRPKGTPSMIELLIMANNGEDLRDYGLDVNGFWELPEGVGCLRKRIQAPSRGMLSTVIYPLRSDTKLNFVDENKVSEHYMGGDRDRYVHSVIGVVSPIEILDRGEDIGKLIVVGPRNSIEDYANRVERKIMDDVFIPR